MAKVGWGCRIYHPFPCKKLTEDRACCGQVRGISRRGLVADRGMRPAGVVVDSPGGQLLAGVVEAEEQALVQQLVAHPAVERLDEPVLCRVTRRDVRRWATPSRIAAGPTIFCQKLVQRGLVQHRIRQQSLEPAVLFLQRPQPLRVRYT